MDSILQAAITCVMTWSAGSARWYDPDIMKQWGTNIKPMTVFFLLYSITVGFILCFILIKLYQKHNNRILYIAISITAGTHIFAEAIKCTESFFIAIPLAVILLIINILLLEKNFKEKQTCEMYYQHLLKQQEFYLKDLRELELNFANSNQESNPANYKIKTSLPIIDVLLDEKKETCQFDHILLQETWCDLSSSCIANYD